MLHFPNHGKVANSLLTRFHNLSFCCPDHSMTLISGKIYGTTPQHFTKKPWPKTVKYNSDKNIMPSDDMRLLT